MTLLYPSAAAAAAPGLESEAAPWNAGTGLDPASSQPAAHAICRPAETAIGWLSWRMALEKAGNRQPSRGFLRAVGLPVSQQGDHGRGEQGDVVDRRSGLSA
ncbi:unnamed protein product [Boreogadus saida]